VGKVVQVALATENIDEVIVVDDGSTDDGGTAISKLSDSRLRFIQHNRNLGKTQAIKTGLAQCSVDDIVLFLDADLHNLTAGHLRSLLDPVIAGRADHTYSGRESVPFLNVLSGDRALKLTQWKQFFDDGSISGYGLEMMMNRYAMRQDLKVLQIRWNDVAQTYKATKQGSRLRGLRAELTAILDIMRSTGPLQFFWIHGMFWFRTRRYELYEPDSRE